MVGSEIEKVPETKSVSIFITIDEGNQYDIEFDGNKEFWDITLKKDVTNLFKEGNKNDFGIKKSVRNIRERYKKAGYSETRVKIEDEIKAEKAIRKVRFVIDEGHQSVVDSIEITGNHVFDDEKIKKQMLTQLPGFLGDGVFVPETLEEDISAIQSLYIGQGYADATVKKHLKQSDDKQKVTLHLEIEEGVQTLVSSVKITGNKILSDEEAYKTLSMKLGEPFQKDRVQNDENALASQIAEKGYPHIRVNGDVSISEDHSGATVIYNVDEGPYVEMGEIYYAGNFRTKRIVLLKELEIKTQAPFSLVKMLETQRNIRNMNIFDSVQFKAVGLKEKADKVNLFVEMEEKKPYFVQVGTGYDTERNFYAHAKSGDRNLFGTNKSAWLSGEVSQIGYQGEFGLTEPRLFGSRFSTTFGLFTEEREEFNQDFGVRTIGSSLGFSRKWIEHLNTSLNFRFEQRDQFRLDTVVSDAYASEEFEMRRIFVTTPSVSYDTRDSFIRPRKGMFSSLSVDISQGLENSLDNFLKYRADARYYWTPVDHLTLACHGRVGYIDPFASQEKVPDDQLFFLGGTSDVRGFRENMLSFDAESDPVGGHTAILGSLEARIDLGVNFEFTTFYDIGSLRDTFENTETKDFRSTAGVGLRYITPIGPIGFLYGVKLDREEGEKLRKTSFYNGLYVLDILQPRHPKPASSLVLSLRGSCLVTGTQRLCLQW